MRSLRSGGAKETKAKQQLHLDFGQRSIGLLTCPSCGMVYDRTAEDMATHGKFCEWSGVHRALRAPASAPQLTSCLTGLGRVLTYLTSQSPDSPLRPIAGTEGGPSALLARCYQLEAPCRKTLQPLLRAAGIDAARPPHSIIFLVWSHAPTTPLVAVGFEPISAPITAKPFAPEQHHAPQREGSPAPRPPLATETPPRSVSAIITFLRYDHSTLPTEPAAAAPPATKIQPLLSFATSPAPVTDLLALRVDRTVGKKMTRDIDARRSCPPSLLVAGVLDGVCQYGLYGAPFEKSALAFSAALSREMSRSSTIDTVRDYLHPFSLETIDLV